MYIIIIFSFDNLSKNYDFEMANQYICNFNQWNNDLRFYLCVFHMRCYEHCYVFKCFDVKQEM